MTAITIDLDGTLVDSVPDLHASVNATLRTLELPERDLEQVRNWVGNGVERLLSRAITADFDGQLEQELLDRAQKIFLAHYVDFNGRFSHPYPGVIETLEALRKAGHRMACVTNKPATPARKLLAHHALERFFEFTLGGDTLSRKKPDALPLLFVAGQFSVAPASLTHIGDSVSDVQAARAAKCRIIAVSYGYNHGRDIHTEQPDHVVDSFTDLLELLH
jgi:phosphoglycolate phosphatase